MKVRFARGYLTFQPEDQRDQKVLNRIHDLAEEGVEIEVNWTNVHENNVTQLEMKVRPLNVKK